MTTEYEYERVEIKPSDSSWVGQEVFLNPDFPQYPGFKILAVGETQVFMRWLGKHIFGAAEDIYKLNEREFYIRKPKRKMLKIARCVFEKENKYWIVSQDLITHEEAKQRLGKSLIKWPYGEIIEVEEGD